MKKKNKQDATLINTTSLKKRVSKLEVQMKLMKVQISLLRKLHELKQ